MVVTPPAREESEPFHDLHERVIKFMGRFTTAQHGMNTAIESYLTRKMPVLGPALADEFFGRIRDDQRLRVFVAFARDCGYSGDLTDFRRIYDRAKQTRDLIGHSLDVTGPVWGSAGWHVGVTRLRTTKTNLVPSPLLPSTFDRLGHDCDWMDQHAMRALYEFDASIFVAPPGWTAPEPAIPPRTPSNGEPLT